MAWELNNDRPIYTQLGEKIQMQIISGFYKPGDKLPSVREFAADAGVNPNTMQKALGELERSLLVETQRTSGRVVTGDVELIHNVKTEIAKEQIRIFFQKMKELGFEPEETIALVKSASKEGI